MTYEDTFSSPVSATGCSENSDTFQIFAYHTRVKMVGPTISKKYL